MTVTRFALGLLLVSSVHAFWRLPCNKPVLNGRVDPIVTPGKASSHDHTIMGSGAIGLDTTFEDLRKSNCSTCKVKDDQSAYWVPELYYQFKNGSFQGVEHGGMLVYYLQRYGSNETVQAFPDGLRMLAGDPYLRSNTNTPEAKAITWNCIDFHGPAEPQTSGFANTNCPDGLRAQVFFPGCWDGKNLDSPDHKSHMAYPDGIDNGQCPPSHPIHLISIFYEVWFTVAPFNALNDGGRFVLSNGDPTGYGLHGDFMNGWDRNVLSRAVAQCTALSGVIEDCPVFQNEGRFYADSVINSCAATNPLPDEHTGPGALLSNLPGCVAVTEGPAPASPADLVPGCVVGSASGSGTGSVSPVPSSSATSSASSSSAASSPSMASHVDAAGTSSSATPSQASDSSSSTPVMSAQPTTTTQMEPAPPSSSPSQSFNSSKSSQPALVAEPTTTQMKPASSPTLPSTSGSSGAGMPSESHVPSPSPSTTEAHPDHGNGHHGGGGLCGEAPHSAYPTSSMLPPRRRHMKHGYRSPTHF